MIRNSIPIIRGLWGNTKHHRREILLKPIFTDEIVYVWGLDNRNYLEGLGYKTHLMSEDFIDPRYSSSLLFLHKIEIIIEACKLNKPFIFLDWDCYIVRPLDEFFYDSLNKGNEIQMPSYCLPISTELYSEEVEDGTPFINLPGSFLNASIQRHSWHINEWMISPNFCFFYTRNMSIGEDFKQLIQSDHNLEGISDEHLFFLWVNCTFDEYVQKYEPNVVYGVPSEKSEILPEFDLETDLISMFNRQLASMKTKRIYFKHV
jgi:hypothetical protein